MEVYFKKPYVGATSIFNFRSVTTDRDKYVKLTDTFQQVEDYYVDPEGVVWIEQDGFMVEKTI